MKRLKVIVIVALIFLLGITPAGSVVNAATGDFTVSVSAEESNKGNTYDVTVDITNNSKDFTGEFSLIMETVHGSKTAFLVDIAIPAGTNKQYVVKVPDVELGIDNLVEIDIHNQNNKSVYAEKFRNVFSRYSNTMNVGILSNKPESLSLLDMNGTEYHYDTSSFRIRLDELNENNLSDELSKEKVLVIDDYDTSSLSEDTVKKIENWVFEGGMLLLGTGVNGEKVLSGFDKSFTGATFSGTYSYEAGIDINGETRRVELADIQFDSSYNYSSNVYNNAKKYGNGSIGIATVAIKDIKGDVSELDIISEFYNCLFVNKSNSSSVFKHIDMDNYIGYMEKPAKTGSGLITVIVIIYIILVGPVLYLVLKAMNQREKIWYIIPCMSLLFIGFIFVLGLSIRVRGRSVKSVNMVNVADGTKETYVFGYSPKKNDWDMKLKESYDSGVSLGSTSYTSKTKYSGSVKSTSNGMNLTCYPGEAFDICSFLMYGSENTSGGFDFAQDDFIGTTFGSVKNSTGVDLDYVLVFDDNSYTLMKDVKNGSEIDLSGSSVSSGNYYAYNNFAQTLARGDYNSKRYDTAAELSALSIAANSIETNGNIIVVGIRKSSSVTTDNEQSWTCYYQY